MSASPAKIGDETAHTRSPERPGVAIPVGDVDEVDIAEEELGVTQPRG